MFGGCVAKKVAAKKSDVLSDRVEFVGGMRWSIFGRNSGSNVTWPFVRLSLTNRGLSLCPNGVARHFRIIPPFDFTWSNIARVECLYRGGIRFILRRGHPVVFW